MVSVEKHVVARLHVVGYGLIALVLVERVEALFMLRCVYCCRVQLKSRCVSSFRIVVDFQLV